jgi:hypothetical protein
MNLDLWDHLSSIVTAIVALGGLAGATTGLVWRRRRSWWRTLGPFWEPRRDAGGADRYPLDAHVPALDLVYVPRRAVARNKPSHLTVPTDDLILSGRDHVLLIGPPGSGKTALVRHAAATSARRWLASAGRRRDAPAGPVLVAIPAADLVRRTLYQAVTAACAPWTPELDREPLPHRPLVVLIDGLDEIVDPNQRSEVINKLAREAIPLRHWRLVVTTRPLGDRELRTLGRFTAYHLAPFTSEDVTRLAHAWFAGDGAKADRFVAWLEAQRLGASARSPLLTTVAAALWDQEVPAVISAPSPAGLLDRFIDLLLKARRAGDDWSGEDLRALLEVAAKAALAGEDVLSAAAGWATARLSVAPSRDQLRKILLSTGIFGEQRNVLTATWPSLIEFLAANPDDHDLSPQSLSTAVRDPARRAVATWAIGRSGRSEAFLETMLTEPSGPIDLARVVAAGFPVPDRLRTDVLVALLADPSASASALLATLATDRDHLARLRDLAGDENQPRSVRRAAQLFFAQQALA